MKSYYYIPQPIIHGRFCKESKNRFLAMVEINVLLVSTQAATARTRYAILAVKHDRHNILLNTSLSNKALFHYLQYHRNYYYGAESHIYAESCIDDYKADLFVESPVQKKLLR